MENPYGQATKNIDPLTIASANEEVSVEVIHSASLETMETHELSDAISSGSSFEILSVKEDVGAVQGNVDDSESVHSILENCVADNSNSDKTYRDERTQKYVMESEFEFLEDGESDDSDNFVKVFRVNVRRDESGDNLDQPPSTGPEPAEHLIHAAILEPDKRSDVTEEMRVVAASSNAKDKNQNTEQENYQDGDQDTGQKCIQDNDHESTQDNNQNNDQGINRDADQESDKDNEHENDPEDIDQVGIDQKGIDQEGIDQEGIDQEDIDQEDIDQEGIDQEDIDQEGIDQEGIDLECTEDSDLHTERSVTEPTQEAEENRIVVVERDDFLPFDLALARWLDQETQHMRAFFQWLSRFSYIRHCLVVLTFALVIIWLRTPGERIRCTYKDIDENFNFVLKNKFSFPRCLDNPAKEIYELAATVHVHQMTNLILRNESLSYKVSELSKANQELENSLADTVARFSKQLVKNRELEDRIMNLMEKLEPHPPEHLQSRAKGRLTRDAVIYDDEWDQLNSRSSQTWKKSSDVDDAFIHLMEIVKVFRNTTLKQEQINHDHKTDLRKQATVFQTFLQLFVKTNANASNQNLADQLDVLENVFSTTAQCANRLQTLIPSKSIYDIFSLGWHQVEEIVSIEASSKEEAMSERGNKLTLEPCHMFMSKVTKASAASPYTYGKKELQQYINKTQDAVDKIGQAVKSTFEAIKNLTDKFFTNGDLFNSFGHKFKTTIERMNKRFKKGFKKLRGKVNRKFKGSLRELSKSMRAGWDKINKRNNSVEALLSGTKKRFWKRGAKQIVKSNHPVPVEDSMNVQDPMKTEINPFEEIKVDVELNKLKSDLEAEMSKDRAVLQMHRLDSLLDEPIWMDEYQLIKEMSAIRSKSMAPLRKISFEILKLTPSEFNSLDSMKREDFSKRLSAFSVAGFDISNWAENWLNCQQRWWNEMVLGNSAWFEELVSSCRPWLVKWQSEVQEELINKKQGVHSWGGRSLSFSSADKLNGHCKKKDCSDRKQIDKENTKRTTTYASLDSKSKFDYANQMHFDSVDDKDSKWYFRQSDSHDSSDPDWYFEMMQDRENGRHDSKWYFRNKRDATQPHQKPVRKGYRGR